MLIHPNFRLAAGYFHRTVVRNSSACRGDHAVRILLSFDETRSNSEMHALKSSAVVKERQQQQI